MMFERTPHEEGGRRLVREDETGRPPAMPKSPLRKRGEKRRNRVRPARRHPVDGASRRGIRRDPDENQVASAHGIGHGTERGLTNPREVVVKQRMGPTRRPGRPTRSEGDAGHHRSSVEPKGTTGRQPRRGTRPREGRPTNARIRRAMVRTRSRSKASRDNVPKIRCQRRNWKRNRRKTPRIDGVRKVRGGEGHGDVNHRGAATRLG